MRNYSNHFIHVSSSALTCIAVLTADQWFRDKQDQQSTVRSLDREDVVAQLRRYVQDVGSRRDGVGEGAEDVDERGALRAARAWGRRVSSPSAARSRRRRRGGGAR